MAEPRPARRRRLMSHPSPDEFDPATASSPQAPTNMDTAPAPPLPPGLPAAGGAATRYRPLRLHAKGGLGEVFLARDEELGRDVALKSIKPGRAEDADGRQRFLREALITGGLEHPGIVPVYGLVQGDDG